MTTPTFGQVLRAAAIARSKQAGETDPILKQWVFSLVHRSLVDVYGPDYSTRCLEISAATKTLLDRYGMGGNILMGAICLPEITPSRTTWTWAGFWGPDHHFWATTNLREIVDLALGQLHLHPVTRAHQPFRAPPMWWNTNQGLPSVIMYMPYRAMGGVLSRDDQPQLDRLVKRVVELEDDLLTKQISSSDITFGTIVSKVDDLNALAANSDPWASLANHFEPIPLPTWVEHRLEELKNGKPYTESELPQPDAPMFRKKLKR